MRRINSSRFYRIRETIALVLTLVGALLVAALLLTGPPAYLSASQPGDMASYSVCSDSTQESLTARGKLQRRLHDGFDAVVAAVHRVINVFAEPVRRVFRAAAHPRPLTEVPATIITPYFIEIPAYSEAG